MPKLPTQLTWRRFICILKALGYIQMDSTRGSARDFHNPNRIPDLVTFHEPHGNETLKQGTLSEYLRKLHLDRDDFFKLLNNC